MPVDEFVVSCGTRGGQKDGAQSKLLTKRTDPFGL